MKRVYSLKGRTIFRSIFQDGARYQKRGIRIIIQRPCKEQALQLTAAPSQGRNIRIGIALSKQLGNAYQRNTIKRRIRAICREMLESMSSGTSMIIRFEREALQVTFTEQKRIIRSLLNKAGIIQ